MKYTNCTTCGTQLRPSTATVHDFPGTSRHITGGTCATCYSMQRRAKKRAEDGHPGITPEEHARINTMRRDLTAWVLEWRRRNGKPLDAPIDGMSARVGLAA